MPPPNGSQPKQRPPRKAKVERPLIDHSYTDHLHDPFCNEVGASGKITGVKGGVAEIFPEVLHRMLNTADHEDIVSWQPHGRSFCVRKKIEFVDLVVPKFFRQSKLTSFQRQLNLYGFIRLISGVDKGSYYHPLFLRSRKDLCRRMKRTRLKGIGLKPTASPDTEPDFYSMEPSYQYATHDTVCCEGPVSSFTSAATDEKNPFFSSELEPDTVSSDDTCDFLPVPMTCVSFSSSVRHIVTPTLPCSPVPAPLVESHSRAEFSPDLSLEFLPLLTLGDSDMQDGETVFFAGRPFRFLDMIIDDDDDTEIISAVTNETDVLNILITRRMSKSSSNNDQ